MLLVLVELKKKNRGKAIKMFICLSSSALGKRVSSLNESPY